LRDGTTVAVEQALAHRNYWLEKTEEILLAVGLDDDRIHAPNEKVEMTLLLRGAQTLGEIKDRSERIFAFTDTSEMERVLEKLAEWPDQPLARKLPRQPGQKEARYSHLLSGETALEATTETAPASQPTRIAQLEQQIEQLRSDFDELRRRFDELEAQLR